jgi:hypothetical protein
MRSRFLLKDKKTTPGRIKLLFTRDWQLAKQLNVCCSSRATTEKNKKGKWEV